MSYFSNKCWNIWLCVWKQCWNLILKEDKGWREEMKVRMSWGKNDNTCRGKKEIEVFWLNRHRRLEQSELNLQSHTLSPRVCGRVLQSDCHKKHTHCADAAAIELHVLFFFCLKTFLIQSFSLHTKSWQNLVTKQEVENRKWKYFSTSCPVSLSTVVLLCSSSWFSSLWFWLWGVWSKMMQGHSSGEGRWVLYEQQGEGLNWGIALLLNRRVGQDTVRYPQW